MAPKLRKRLRNNGLSREGSASFTRWLAFSHRVQAGCSSEQGTGTLSWLLWLGAILTAPSAMGFAVQDAHLLPSACWVPPLQCSQTASASSSAILCLHEPQTQTSQICLRLAGQEQELHCMHLRCRAAALAQPQLTAGSPALELCLVHGSFQ